MEQDQENRGKRDAMTESRVDGIGPLQANGVGPLLLVDFTREVCFKSPDSTLKPTIGHQKNRLRLRRMTGVFSAF